MGRFKIDTDGVWVRCLHPYACSAAELTDRVETEDRFRPMNALTGAEACAFGRAASFAND